MQRQSGLDTDREGTGTKKSLMTGVKDIKMVGVSEEDALDRK